MKKWKDLRTLSKYGKVSYYLGAVKIIDEEYKFRIWHPLVIIAFGIQLSGYILESIINFYEDIDSSQYTWK